MSNITRRVGAAVGVLALSTSAAALFAGTALAGGVNGVGGGGGNGGGANANCLIPVGVTAGVIGQGGPVAQCNAAGGAGGGGGNGVG